MLKFVFVILPILNQLVSHVYANEKIENNKGEDIVRRVDNFNTGYGGEQAQSTMVLIDAHGSKVERKMKGKSIEIDSGGDRSISIFLSPADVKGTKLLTWSHKDKDDDQWLYLPSSKRVKRIQSRSKSASFMGSEFSYEDLGSQEPEKYHHVLLREESRPEGVWVIERKSKRKSGYSKQVLWISKTKMNPVKIEYYDRKKELLKTAVFSDFKKFTVDKKSMYRAHKIHIINAQTKKESIFSWEKRTLGLKIAKKEFLKSNLK